MASREGVAARIRGPVDPRALSYYDLDLDAALTIARERISECGK